MTSVTQNRITVAIALGMPCVVALWLLTPAGGAVSSTYVFIALLVVATAVIGLNTWNNGQAASSMRQVLHDAEMVRSVPSVVPSSVPSAVTSAEQNSASRWAAWQLRGEAAADAGRIRALLGFSAIVTAVLLFIGWIA